MHARVRACVRAHGRAAHVRTPIVIRRADIVRRHNSARRISRDALFRFATDPNASTGALGFELETRHSFECPLPLCRASILRARRLRVSI